MPSAPDILAGLHALANQYYPVAILWHAVFFLALAALTGKWRPGMRATAIFLCLPLLSVASLAFMTGNGFTGAVFGLMTVMVFAFGMRLTSTPVMFSGRNGMIAGIIMLAYGLVYPHFLQADNLVTYLFASPAGLIPCPTLAVVMGFLFLLRGLDSRGIMLTVAGFGLLYGLVGVFWLGVWLDMGLIIGATALFTRVKTMYPIGQTPAA
jgi:hypothetical protein